MTTSNLTTKLELRRRELPFCPAPEFLVMPVGPAAPGDLCMHFRNKLCVPVWAIGPSREGCGQPGRLRWGPLGETRLRRGRNGSLEAAIVENIMLFS